MSEVRDWLTSIGLGQYGDAFEENAVDREVLPDLTDDDLEKIGVKLGHRKKLLRAIATLAETDAEGSGGADHGPPAHAERRHLTVLFCDLVDSTRLSRALEMEDLRDVTRAYQEECAKVIEASGGYVARYMGDGVLAYFGYPSASEADPENAVRAGLRLCEAVPKVRSPFPLEVRVGVATGPVVVGDLIGEGASAESAVVGETPNLAARLQSEAEPNWVLISEATQHVVGGLFELECLDPRVVKGFDQPVALWRALEELSVNSRFEALRGGARAEFVGRAGELGLLADRWQSAKGGEGQIVLLSGEPGIGKSRILEELERAIGSEPHVDLKLQCAPHHANSAFHPFIAWLTNHLGFSAGDAVDARLDKLELRFGVNQSERHHICALLAPMLGLPSNRYPTLALTPQERRADLIRAFVTQIVQLAEKAPVLARIEDVHWADPSSCELLEHLYRTVPARPFMFCVTFRPDFDPPWSPYGHLTRLELNRLGRQDCTRMIETVVGPLPEAMQQQVLEKAGGNPLYVEELARSASESAADQGTERFDPVLVPETLQDSLAARLDRLGSAKKIAQTASVIGRQFTGELLHEIADVESGALEDALATLERAGVIIQTATRSEKSYEFAHALIRDAAYAVLLRSERRRLHARVARALQERTGQERPHVFAYHYQLAGEDATASEWWFQAGREAQAQFAPAEAIAHFEASLSALSTTPESIERKHKELSIQALLGEQALIAESYASTRAGIALLRAKELCAELEDYEHAETVLTALNRHYVGLADFPRVLSNGEELMDLGERTGSVSARATGYMASGMATTVMGDLPKAQERLSTAETMLLQGDVGSSTVRDRQVGVVCNLGWIYCQMGYPDRGLEYVQRGLETAEGLHDPSRIGFALLYHCLLYRIRREPSHVERFAQRVLELADEHGLKWWGAQALCYAGWTYAQDGNPARGIDAVQSGLESLRGLGVKPYMPAHLYHLAEAQRIAGSLEEALGSVSEGLKWGETTGEQWDTPDLMRLKGSLLCELGRSDEGEQLLKGALDKLQQTRARLWELRVGLGLATKWSRESRVKEARKLLEPVYVWFREALDTPDLVEAGSLLERLRDA